MVIYLLLAFAFLVIFVLTMFNKISFKQKDDNSKKRVKLTLAVITGSNALGMILFMIAELVDVLYLPFNIIGIIIIVGTIIFYFVQDYLYKENLKKNKESETK